MADSTTGESGVPERRSRAEQCRKNAQDKSQVKRKAAFEALATLVKQRKSITKSAVARLAGVSVPFLHAHSDLIEAIESAAGQQIGSDAQPGGAERGKEQLIAALRRRLDQMKTALDERDALLRTKQREIERLYGKLAEFGDARHWGQKNQTIQVLESDNAELRKQKEHYFNMACRYKAEIESTRDLLAFEQQANTTEI